MREERISLNDISKRTLDLGYVGEENHTQVVIVCTSMFKKYPAATVTMVAKPPSGDLYPVTLTKEDNTVVWNVSPGDIAYAGSGQFQLTFTNGTEIIKREYGSYSVKPSLTATGEPPEPIEDWIESVNQAVQGKIDNPSTPGTDGQFLATDGEGGVEWRTGGGMSQAVKTAFLNLFEHIVYTDGNASNYITALQQAWGDTGTLTSITAVFTQGSAVIYDTDTLDTLKQYLVVTGLYTLGSHTYTQEITDYTLSGTLTAGTSTITVTVGSLTTTFTVTVTSTSDYEFYTKIVTTGKEHIDPGLYETDLDGCHFEYKAIPNSTQASSGHILSSRYNYVAFPQLKSENSTKFGVIMAKIANGTEKIYGSVSSPAWANGDEITVVAYADNDKSVSMNGTTIISSVPVGSTTPSSSNKYLIFAYGNAPTDSAYRFRGKLYYLKIYNSSNVLIHHYVPAKKISTSKYGLYDQVTDTFFSSATSYDFTVE